MPKSNPMAVAAKVWARVNVGAVDECWPWTGYVGQDGYGGLRVPCQCGEGSVLRRAHRIVYEAVVGPVGEGLVLDHLCRNRRCVNPAHLEAVATGENTRRGVSPSAVNARKTHCLNGHPLSGLNLLGSSDGHRRCRTCKRERARALRTTGGLASPSQEDRHAGE